MTVLSRAAAATLPEPIKPMLIGAAPEPGIVHLGVGAFHRAHQAVFTEQGMSASGDKSWGIVGVAPRTAGVVGALARQDGLFTVLERSHRHSTARVVNAFTELMHAPSAGDGVVERIASAQTRAITLTITEKGYLLDPATDDLRDEDAVRTDLAVISAGEVPSTAVGMLVAGLLRRAARGGLPVTVLSCDNLMGNGRVLAHVVRRFADRLPAAASTELTAYMDESVTFPASMVDRIVPAITSGDLAVVSELTGMHDDAAVVAEPFSQWVIEDNFAAALPPWREAGAEIVGDVTPYETAKLRILNAAHSMTAYLGSLAGFRTIAEALADPAIERAVRALQCEAIGTVEPPVGWNLSSYADSVLARFDNAALGHRCDQVAADGSQKLPIRVVPTLRVVRTGGELPVWSMLALAAWARFVVHARDDEGRELRVADPLLTRIRAAATRVADHDVPGAVLRRAEILGDADEDTDTAARLAQLYRDLGRYGVREVCRVLAREAA